VVIDRDVAVPLVIDVAIHDPQQSVVDVLAGESGLSRQRIRQAMDKGAVWLTRGHQTRRVRRRQAVLHLADTLHLNYNPVVLAEQPLAATLVADLGGYSVWDKPAGMRSQGSRWGDHTSLPRWAEKHLQPPRGAFIVHRLDRAASGLMMLAHDKRSAAALSRLFRERRVEKQYQVVVQGCFPSVGEGVEMDDPLDGRVAYTLARRLGYDVALDRSTLLVNITTGRKHQIRRHLSQRGFAVVGDRLYGGAASDEVGLQLRSVLLAFVCPLVGEPKTFRLSAGAVTHRRE
jgi:tRNA pseudouridine32 synthase/23S rRNA pseudouridine746 synthase